jgi:lipopolysaccharide export system protein LptA
MKGNQLLYHLDGGKLNLDQYVNKRVGIVGTVEEQDPSTGARLIRIKGIEVLSQ